ncbi:homoserine O-succinyltransferase [uncultured Helicobacter sp.]|uniref:homoserine O-succinyltransferase n=1 Tax=uncultured Helicobacter sp. TaxID=175537 RepID=UPI002592C36E|nr:homoserine O-succinyltransferase [uncultured Helicobacter sp.]
MPLIIPEQIPAYKLLKDYVFIIGQKRAIMQDIRPLEVLIVNLMPIKIQTENQILSLIGNSPLQVNITLLATQSYKGTNTPQSHLDRFYTKFSDIVGKNFDGAIVTGAPIEHLAFEEVKYWQELKEVMNYLRKHCTSTMYLCWGAMAGLYHFYHIDKIALSHKLFGVFKHRATADDVLLSGLNDTIKIPHSRHSGIDEKKVRALSKQGTLKILLEGKKSGISIIKDHKDIFILGHPEYSKETLDNEYKRDKAKGLSISKPKKYYDNNGAPQMTWRSDASVIFANWLNFNVYQATPFKF